MHRDESKLFSWIELLAATSMRPTTLFDSATLRNQSLILN
ncbi:hypothetical protein PLANPX_4238 [Lacipirellula parvula]|uniref:Uncharacterized protein n=1 Tax=Lacipirellula parvula TaxID=2650471 RepID=A0A5K7XJP1_9BACT|nr:hypothetical protein PLANPX_4238 [Lacipirellula parvula]